MEINPCVIINEFKWRIIYRNWFIVHLFSVSKQYKKYKIVYIFLDNPRTRSFRWNPRNPATTGSYNRAALMA